MSRLTTEQIAVYMRNLPQWRFEEDRLTKTFHFTNFSESLQFTNRVGTLAESANHHPEILIRYNRVKITLTTHGENGVTGKDLLLAQQIDSI